MTRKYFRAAELRLCRRRASPKIAYSLCGSPAQNLERGHAQADPWAVQAAKLYLVSSHTYSVAPERTHLPIHPPRFLIQTMGLIMKEHKRIVRRSVTVPVPRGRLTDGVSSPSPSRGAQMGAKPSESSPPGCSSAPTRSRQPTPTPSSTRGVGGRRPCGGRRGEDHHFYGRNDQANKGRLVRACRPTQRSRRAFPVLAAGEEARIHAVM
jgi:hypothetical protein